MASIQKIDNHGRVKYRVDFGVVAGRRRRKFYDTHTEARYAAGRHDRERREIGNAWIELPARERHAILTILEEIKAAGESLAGVWQAHQERATRRAGVSLSSAVEKFLKDKEAAGLRPLYVKGLRQTMRLLIDGTRDADVADVTRDQVGGLLFGEGLKLNTVQGRKSRFQSFFTWAVKAGLREDNPAALIESPRYEQPEPKILTVDQCAALVAAAAKNDRAMLEYLALALFLGIRPEECRRLGKKAVDLERGVVTIAGAAAKTRDRRLVEINAPARRLLERSRGNWRAARSTFTRRVRRLADAAGIKEWPRDVLRHTAASHFYVLHGIDKATEQLGHSADVMLKHYRQLVTREDSEAWLEIGAGKA